MTDGLDVIVTAQRRAERLVDVPLSVNSINSVDLEAKHIDSLANLTQAVTSLRFEGQAPQFEPTLRGIGTLVQGGGVDASVAVYVDGVYLPNSSGMNFNLPNVSDVQVLKGPQGTLFGRNTTGGAILISTAQPSFTWTGNVKGTYASYDDGRVQGYLSGPITSNIAIGVSGFYRESPGFTVNIANGQHDARLKLFNIRPSLLFSNNDNLKIRLIYEHSYAFDTSSLGLFNVDGYALARNFPGALISSQFPRFAADTAPVNLTRADAFTAIGDLQLSKSTALKSVTSYRHDSNLFVSDADMSNLPLLSVAQMLKFKTFSQEFTVSHKSGPLDLVAGANYYNSIADSPFTTITSFGVSNMIDSSKIKSEAIGVFADGTYELTQGLFLTAGARFSSERKDLAVQYGGVPPVVSDHRHWNAVTPRAALRYQFDPGDNVYFSFSKGYKPGAYAGFPPNLVKPEHVTAYEAGYKHASPLFDLNAAAFYYKYTDFQVTTFDFTTNLGVTINAPGERTYGFELETTIRPVPEWRINLSGAYLNARFTDFREATIQVANGAGQWVSAPRDATGTIVPRSPKWSGNVSTSYDLNIGIGKVRLGANMSFASSLYNLMNEQFRNPAYATVGLNAAFTPTGDHWKIEAFVTNLTDKHLYAQYQGGPFGTYAIFQPPRVIGGSLSYSF
ncbi:TonB-dependent receptor [Sphingomonas sp. CL5.1]|uniref:TonB-dependent receptor n=1 Tax=Sphingomonas sp. CL5.1 TaxID=2653203 RepID=UPI001582F140|nr:TonB-dependent receptor [Sphingomonas sp. CL5.1]QKS00575.1 TonB-dependent receptor [Sphingomonas sp. CL5.1]